MTGGPGSTLGRESAPTEEVLPPVDLADYHFDLPAERIAQVPIDRREDARLLCVDRQTGHFPSPDPEHRVRDLPSLLREGDLLVVNTTRVLRARLRGHKASGGRVEALLLGTDEAAGPDLYRALFKSNGRARPGLSLAFSGAGRTLAAEIHSVHDDGQVTIGFASGADPYSIGEVPLPPYIKRSEADAAGRLGALDRDRYQTVYADTPGAVAAPTAGLHLTPELLARLAHRGIARAEVLLHVGIGTFRPVGDDDIVRNRLHREAYALSEETVEAVDRTRAAGGRVIAVGTTTTRVLETCVDRGGRLRAGHGETELLIRPGRPLRAIDGLLTNFHLPGSSLLLLVAAIVGREPMLAAYRHAISAQYRFFSYGDAMLIL